MTILLCLFLLLVANGAPILVRWLPGIRHWHRPLDADHHLADGRQLFGDHKTWRGLIAAVLLTAAAGWLLNLPLWLGALFGALSMLGDLLASFIKRRRQLTPGAAAPGLDQLPEALLPLLVLYQPLGLGWQEILLVPPLFMLINVLMSRGLYRLHIRRRPW
ncbi:CDP-archaeol synthase [Thiohalophilus thiocyanatoxydans]|uniref:CDP-2,3-bis-(O-geranylgeranyl)-sn-glycerol synthase n=1 Tax=Thiohalophilus thiocyanatoxydans TaxID=381308 RepID=A0A4R8IJS5_9GAMM|nr:CDP-archaeol synthase [Thiohalophilus thiocyanatoxydans]TDY00981.1 CDP-2,3-bis-(O-geranylgeranyl)-sn-glycerol synthase [Thiohalophilus thiocyanatoxydans]